jgi:hypothetical protein
MSKVLEISKGGYKFHVDLHAVAHDRADYYGKNDPDPDYDTTYKAEYEFTSTDTAEAIDWFENNMNWSEIADEHKRVAEYPEPPKSPSDIEYTDDVEIEVVEVPAKATGSEAA